MGRIQPPQGFRLVLGDIDAGNSSYERASAIRYGIKRGEMFDNIAGVHRINGRDTSPRCPKLFYWRNFRTARRSAPTKKGNYFPLGRDNGLTTSVVVVVDSNPVLRFGFPTESTSLPV